MKEQQNNHISLCLFFFPIFIGILGILTHIAFSLNISELAYIKSAWDEDMYAYFALHDSRNSLYRWLSVSFVQTLFSLFHNNLNITLIVMDFLFPALCAYLCCRLSIHLGFKKAAHVFLATCLLLFSSDILTFSNIALWGKIPAAISPFAISSLPENLQMILPNLRTSFLSLYRSPEPQISYLVLFSFLTVLFLYITQTNKKRYLALLTFIAVLLPFIYITIGISILLYMALCSFIGLVIQRDKTFLPLSILTLLFASYYAVFFFIKTQNTEAASFIFTSHLPIIAPSVLIGVFGIVFTFISQHIPFNIWELLKNPPRISNKYLLALACFALPVITLNQQIITGYMIQSRNWEFYANYSFIAFGILLIWHDFSPLIYKITPKKISSYFYLIPPLFALLLLCAQWDTYTRFAPRNLSSIAAAEIIHTLKDQIPDTVFIFDNPNLEAGTRNRLQHLGIEEINIVAGRIGYIQNPIAPMLKTEEGFQATHAPLKTEGFIFFDHQGLSVATLTDKMSHSAKNGLCGLHLSYFISVRDCWYPLTDFRAVRTQGIKNAIPNIIQDYERFLETPAERLQYKSIIYMTDTPEQNTLEKPWTSTHVKSVTVGKHPSVTLYAYQHISP